jgi:DNA-binding NarL/FixJ family response regulator
MKILLVEDEMLVAIFTEDILQRIGFNNIIHVTTGEKAINDALATKFDMILMDIRLAGTIDGIQAAAEIISKTDTPVIFVTGYDDQKVQQKAEELKPLGYLIKPLEYRDLKDIVDRYMNFKDKK